MRCLCGFLVVLLAGCGGGGGGGGSPAADHQSADTSAPVLGTVSVAAPGRFTGGAITLTLVATDDRAVAALTATVAKPDGSIVEVALADAGGGTFNGSFQARANTRQDGQPEAYAILVIARDAAGNATTANTQASVPAPGLPPGTPEFALVP